MLNRFNTIMVFAMLVSGCASKPTTIYHWGSYQGQVYEYLKGEGKPQDEQIAILEAEIEAARAAGKPLPPGYHAHLGLLYGHAGREDEMKRQLELERTSFPESAPFIDFLLNNFKKQG